MTWVFSHLVFVSSKDRRKKKAFQFSTKFSANSVFTRIADNGAYLLVFENVGHFLGSMRRWQNWRHGQPLLARTTPVQTRTQVSVISDDNGEGCTHSVPLYLSLSLFFVCMNLMISVTMAQTIVKEISPIHAGIFRALLLFAKMQRSNPCLKREYLFCLSLPPTLQFLEKMSTDNNSTELLMGTLFSILPWTNSSSNQTWQRLIIGLFP